jgi:hypothetical protein
MNHLVEHGVNLVMAQVQTTPFDDTMAPVDLDSTIAIP